MNAQQAAFVEEFSAVEELAGVCGVGAAGNCRVATEAALPVAPDGAATGRAAVPVTIATAAGHDRAVEQEGECGQVWHEEEAAENGVGRMHRREALDGDEISAVAWTAITINVFDRTSILGKHPLRDSPAR